MGELEQDGEYEEDRDEDGQDDVHGGEGVEEEEEEQEEDGDVGASPSFRVQETCRVPCPIYPGPSPSHLRTSIPTSHGQVRTCSRGPSKV